MKNKGITLIALVITIVVLIILATVAINLSLGNNGIFNRAKTAKEQYANAQEDEETQIAKYSNVIDGYVSANRDYETEISTLKDEIFTLKEQVSDLKTKNNCKAGVVTMPACTGNNGTYADVLFDTAFSNKDYAISISSEVTGNSWSYCSYQISLKTVNGFRISMWQNVNVNLASHKVYWVAIPYNK